MDSMAPSLSLDSALVRPWQRSPALLAVGAGVVLSPPATAAEACTAWEDSSLIAEVDSLAINESSGLAASKQRPGLWFTHNDAGGSAELYVFSETGDHVETHAVVGAAFRDWEALGDGPCPDDVDAEHCLFIGDIGDNGRSRSDVFVYVVPEPAPGEDAEVQALWRLGWPDGAEDSEALVVHPCSGRVYLITKHNDGRDASVWRLPEEPVLDVDPAPLEWVATLPQPWLGGSGQVTGADWSDGGDQLVLRTYTGAWLWPTDPASPDAHWDTAPVAVPLDTAGQGESIAIASTGGLLATTEGVPMRVVSTPCATSVEAPVCPEIDTTPEPGDSGGDPSRDTATTADTGADTQDDTPSPTRATHPEPGGCGDRSRGLLLLPLLALPWYRRAEGSRQHGSPTGGPKAAQETR